jgi:hypothetical protein
MVRTIVLLGSAVLVLSVGLGGCSGGSGGGGLPSGTLTIQGLVLSAIGERVHNAAVWISGNGPFITDALGAFTATGMPSPYQAVIVYGAESVADVWPSLTRPDPVFQFPDLVLVDTLSASVSGTVMGGAGYPLPPGHESEVHVALSPATGGGSVTPDPMTGAYDFMTLPWSGPPTTGASLVALQYTLDANGDPLTFTGLGIRQLSALTVGDTLGLQDILLAPVSTGIVSGMMTLPPGHVPFFAALLFRPASGGVFGLDAGPAFSASFFLRTPVTGAIARDLLSFSSDASGTSTTVTYRKDLPDPAMNLSIVVPETTGLVLPIAGITGVDHATLFQVTPNPGDRIFTVTFAPTAGPGPTIHLRTADPEFTIPDLSDLGVAIPPGSEYTWDVDAYGPLATLDELAIAGDLLLFSNFYSNGSADAFLSSGANRTFTFGP